MSISIKDLKDPAGEAAGGSAFLAGGEQHRAQLYHLFMQAPALICVLRGPELVFEMANPRYQQVVGDRPLLGKPIREALPELAGQGICELLDQVYRSGEPFPSHEVPVRYDQRGDGSTEQAYFTFVYQPLRDLRGAVEGVMVFGFEVSDLVRARQQAEAAQRDLRVTEERLRMAVEGASLGLWHCDLPFDRLQWSARTKEHFGLPADAEVTIGTFYDRLHPDDRERTRQAMDQAMDQAGAYDIEYRTLGPADGRLRWIHARGRPFYRPDGQAYRFDGLTSDVTDLKHAEQERQRLMDELHEEAELRERLLAIVGHDLQNPLSAIRMSTLLLLRRDTLGALERKTLAGIEAAAARMERLTNHILDFARSRQGGGIPVVPRRADLHKVAQQVVDEVAAARPDRVIVLEADGECLGTWDGDTLAEVLSNLVGNAVQHSPGGPITVRIQGAGAEVAVTVHNQGPPIPAAILPILFDPFQRAQGQGEARAKNVGLGLYIARQIALGHGGRLDVQSSAAEGTTFTLVLPRHATARTGTPR